MEMHSGRTHKNAQIALEFLVVFSFVTIIFTLFFALVSTQRAATLSQQEYSLLQLQAQNVADYINQAMNAGNGYTASVPLAGSIDNLPISIAISTAGAIVANLSYGKQIITAYAFSNARNLVINGTELPMSGQVVKVYAIPTYRGELYLQNSHGAIYIDGKPAGEGNLTAGAMVKQDANVKVASFDGTSSYIQIPNSANLQLSSLTLTGWVNYRGPQPDLWDWMAAKQHAWGVGVCGSTMVVCFYDWAGSGRHESTTTLAKNQWYFLVAKIGGGEEQIYLNGTFIYGAPLAVSAQDIGLQIGWGNAGSQFLNGTATNIQVYSTELSDNDIMTLYNEGIDGAPVNTISLTGWWPLHGNAKDYSGAGNDGTTTNVKYESATQINVHAFTNTANASNTIVGLESDRGIVGPSINTSTLQTKITTGNVSAFISSNGLVGTANLTVNVYKGDPSLTANLVGWWPLDMGRGLTALDISGNNNDGTFNTSGWSAGVPLNQSNLMAAKFPGDPAGVSGSDTADGFITVNQSDSLLNIARNNSFTAVLWAKYNGATPAHCQGLLGDWAGNSTGWGKQGFQLQGSNSNSCTLAYINDSMVSWPTGIGSVSNGNWSMVTFQYNGNTGQVQAYLNDTMITSQFLSKNLKLAPSTPLYLGDMAGQPTGFNGFNGSITNVQLYSNYLSTQQVSELYNAGITSTPLGGTGLVGWWPLQGNANDSSTNANDGTVNYNVTFYNANQTRFSNSSYSVYFNGSRWINAGAGSSLNTPNGVTLSAWIYPTNTSTGTIISKNGPFYLAFAKSGTIDCVKGGIYVSSNWYWLCGNSNLPLYTWSHIAMTYNETNETVWYNGKQDASIPVTGAVTTTGAEVTIGWGQPGYNQYFNGYISDVQVYNKALDAQQILQLYQQGLPKPTRLNISLG